MSSSSPSSLPPTRSLLPPSPDLIPTLAILFEPAAAPHIHTLLLLSRHLHLYHHHHHIPPDSSHQYPYQYYTNYTTLVAHIRSILFEYLLSSPSPPSPFLNTDNDNNNNNNNYKVEEEYLQKGRKERREIIKEVINAHPRLGSRAAVAVLGVRNSATPTPIPTTTTSTITTPTISELSTKEQAQLQSSSPVRLKGEEGTETLELLNQKYEEQSGGMRFVTFVNGRGKGEILNELRMRTMKMIRMSEKGDGDDWGKEKEEVVVEEREMKVAIGAVCDIAEDRVRKLGVLTEERAG